MGAEQVIQAGTSQKFFARTNELWSLRIYGNQVIATDVLRINPGNGGKISQYIMLSTVTAQPGNWLQV